MNARIRAAEPTDAAAVAALVTAAGYPARLDGVARMLTGRDDGRFPAVVAERDGAVVGMLVVCCRPSFTRQGWIGTITELMVEPAQQRSEIGEALLHYAKGLAVERGLASLECAVPGVHQPIGGSFLLERGFEQADARTYRWAALESKHPRLPTSRPAGRLAPA